MTSENASYFWLRFRKKRQKLIKTVFSFHLWNIFHASNFFFFFARNFHYTKHDYLHQPNQHQPKTIVHRASVRPYPGPSIGPTLSCTRHRSDPILEQVLAHRNLAPGIGPTRSCTSHRARSCTSHRPNPILHQALARPHPAWAIGPILRQSWYHQHTTTYSTLGSTEVVTRQAKQRRQATQLVCCHFMSVHNCC